MQSLRSPFILIKKSWELFSEKKNLIYLLEVYLPIGILSVLSLLFIYVPFLVSFFNTTAGSVVIMIFDILYIFTMIFVNLAGILGIIRIIDGGKLSAKDTLRVASKKYGKFLIFSIVLYLIYALGIVLLVAPFILVVTWFTFAKFITVEKGMGIKSSLLESKTLVKGSFWKVFGRILIFALFSFFSQTILTFLPYGTGSVIYNLFGALFILPFFFLYREISLAKNL